MMWKWADVTLYRTLNTFSCWSTTESLVFLRIYWSNDFLASKLLFDQSCDRQADVWKVSHNFISSLCVCTYIGSSKTRKPTLWGNLEKKNPVAVHLISGLQWLPIQLAKVTFLNSFTHIVYSSKLLAKYSDMIQISANLISASSLKHFSS